MAGEEQNSNAEKSKAVHLAKLTTSGADLLLLGAIFSMFTNSGLQLILDATLKFIFFPFAALMTIIEAGLSIVEAYLAEEKDKPRTMGRAILNTLAAIAIVVAVVGALKFAITFAPIIFTTVFAVKALYSLASAVYYGVKSRSFVDPELDRIETEKTREKYKELAKENLIQGLIGIPATLAIGVVMMAGITFAAGIPLIVIGAPTVVFGLGWISYKIKNIYDGVYGGGDNQVMRSEASSTPSYLATRLPSRPNAGKAEQGQGQDQVNNKNESIVVVHGQTEFPRYPQENVGCSSFLCGFRPGG